MHLICDLTGSTPLLMHNIRLADPDDEIVEEIAKLTSKKKKTKDDRVEIARLEFLGGLYIDEDGPFIPSQNFRRMIVEAGKVHKKGKDVQRAVVMRDVSASLEYEGPRRADQLWENKAFRHRCAVGIRGARTMRTRPMFAKWSARFDVELLTDVMDQGTFVDLLELASRAEGLCDYRSGGYGRFDTVIKQA